MSSVSKPPQTRLQVRRIQPRSSLQTDEIPLKFILSYSVIAIALVASLGFGYMKYHKSIVRQPSFKSATDKLIYTIQLQAFTVLPLFLSFVNVLAHRIIFGIANPLSGSEVLIEKPVRILTNTLEQTVLTVVSQLVLSTHIRNEHLYWMPFLVFLFVVGRILFIIGYMIHPKFRGLGFLMGAISTSATLIFNFVCALGLTSSFGSGSHKEL